MKVVVLDTIPHEVLDYIQGILRPVNENSTLTYELAKQLIFEYRFGTSGTYEHYFSMIPSGAKCIEIITNSSLLQGLWAEENGVRYQELTWRASLALGYRLPSYIEVLDDRLEFLRVLLAQIDYYKPDIVAVKDIHLYGRRFLSKLRKQGILTVAIHSSPLRDEKILTSYDALVSSLSLFTERAQDLGLQTLQLLPGFDVRNLNEESQSKNIVCSFVGSLHPGTLELLKSANASGIDIDIYAPDSAREILTSNFGQQYKGFAFGRYANLIYGQSRCTINRHGDLARNLSVNMRLFEATGMGSCLFTESSVNLPDLFELDSEIIAYTDLVDLQDKLREYTRDDSAIQIGRLGQQKVLSNHTMLIRYSELIDFFATIL